jgi:hypothetical protein
MPVSMRVFITSKFIGDCIAATRFDEWAKQSWLHSELGASPWSIEAPSLSALVVEFQKLSQDS